MIKKFIRDAKMPQGSFFPRNKRGCQNIKNHIIKAQLHCTGRLHETDTQTFQQFLTIRLLERTFSKSTSQKNNSIILPSQLGCMPEKNISNLALEEYTESYSQGNAKYSSRSLPQEATQHGCASEEALYLELVWSFIMYRPGH